ncbi:MAG: CPBP family intramembrane metalloprotease [Lachnoclostridium sp.]|nr:CPBP family intramembrane metalloprotease [Lachnospira sp.]MCM1248834.1 CPBP family intramembrane metalloprotease [Lachnoclostridium sp.]MCM1536734.1 CPBP family intramembrane metalloprotease [Clostridium sp.]
MENMKEYKKDFSRIGFLYLLAYIIIMAASLVISTIAFRLRPDWYGDMNVIIVLSALPMYLIGMPILALLTRRLPGRTPQKHTMKFGQFILAFIMCVGIMYASNFITVAIAGLVGSLKGSPVDNTVADIAAGADTWVTFGYMVLIAPVFEELIFRKLIVDKTLKYGQGVAIVMSGVMFGLFHGNINQCLYAATMGMFLAFLYAKTGNIKITIGIHMLVNFIGSIISVQVLKLIDYEGLLDIMEEPVEQQTTLLMRHIMENFPGYMIYMLYACIIMGLMVAGVILLIVYRKRFVMEPGEVALPKGQRFKTMFLNAGMILYCLFFVGVIIEQLLE